MKTALSRLPLVAAVFGAALIAAACSSSGAASWTYHPLPETPSPGPSSSPGASPSACQSGAAASPRASGSPAAGGSPAASGSPAESASPAASGSPAESSSPTASASAVTSPSVSASVPPVASGSPSESGSPVTSVTPAPATSASPAASASPAESSASPAASASPAESSASPAASASPAESSAPSAGGSPAAGANCVQVEETAQLEIKQGGQKLSELTVKKGTTYTFVITNSAGFEHNFYIGTADKLSVGTVTGLPGIPAFTSGSMELTYKADQDGPLEFACTLPGHYPTMHGTLKVEP